MIISPHIKAIISGLGSKKASKRVYYLGFKKIIACKER
jgi:hypothetical protein